LSESLNPDDIGFSRNDDIRFSPSWGSLNVLGWIRPKDGLILQEYAIPFKLVFKNNWGTHQKWWGKWNQYHRRFSSMSLLNMALVCIRVRLGTSHLVIFLPPWVWVISFDHSSALCHVTMTSDPLMSNTSKSSVVAPICSREVCLYSFQPPSDSLLVLIHKNYIPLSHVDDVGIIMAHLRSRSLLFNFSSLSGKLILILPSGTL